MRSARHVAHLARNGSTLADPGYGSSSSSAAAATGMLSSGAIAMRAGEARWLEMVHLNDAGRGQSLVTLEITGSKPGDGRSASFVTSDVLPLSAEFLRVPVRTAAQTSVAVNGLQAACRVKGSHSHSRSPAACGFAYSAALTPVVHSVTPASGMPGTVLEVYGEH